MMNPATPGERELRITVVFGGRDSGPLLATLPALVEGREAEVLGLFVEDDELLKLAALPHSQELCRLTHVERRLDPAAIERQYRIQARLARRALETAAGLEQARRSFRRVRGTLAALLRQEFEEVDLLVLGPDRPPLPIGHGRGPGREAARSIVVACRDSAAGARALAMADRLARTGHSTLTVLALADTDEDARSLGERLSVSLAGREAQLVTLVRPEAASLAQAIRQAGAEALVLEAGADVFDDLSVRAMRRELECPVLLVR